MNTPLGVFKLDVARMAKETIVYTPDRDVVTEILLTPCPEKLKCGTDPYVGREELIDMLLEDEEEYRDEAGFFRDCE